MVLTPHTPQHNRIIIPQFPGWLSVPILPKYLMETLHCLMKFRPLNQFQNLLTKHILKQKVTTVLI